MRNIWLARAPWRPEFLRSGCRKTIADNSEDMEKRENPIGTICLGLRSILAKNCSVQQHTGDVQCKWGPTNHPSCRFEKVEQFLESFCYSKPPLVHAANKCSISCKTCTKLTVPSVERIKLEFYNLSLIAKNARIWKRRGSMVYQGT